MYIKAQSEVLEGICHSRAIQISELKLDAAGYCKIIPKTTTISLIASLVKSHS